MASLPKSYRRVVLVRRPPGEPAESDFRVEEVPMPEPRHGEALVKVAYLSLDPYQRGRMREAASYAANVGLGEVMTGGVVGEVVASQHPGFKAGDIAAFAITTPGGQETPAVLVQCRSSDEAERVRLRDEIRERVRSVTGMNCVIELIPPRTLPRTSSGKLSRAKARNLYLAGEIKPYAIAA